MKRFSVSLFVILLAIFFSGVSADAKKPNRLEVKSAVVDLENGKIYIYGKNFGENPLVRLDDADLAVEASSDDFIEALLLVDIEPGTSGTYRLVVARGMDKWGHKGKGDDDRGWKKYKASIFWHPEKADSIDITIGAFDNTGPGTGVTITQETIHFLLDRPPPGVTTWTQEIYCPTGSGSTAISAGYATGSDQIIVTESRVIDDEYGRRCSFSGKYPSLPGGYVDLSCECIK